LIPTEALEAALQAMQGESDPYERIKAEELLRGYHCRWGAQELRVLAVEVQFSTPLVNPETGAASRTFVSGGKIDAMAQEGDDDVIVEHKSSSADLAMGSVYWRGLRMNTQISTYMRGARALGYEPRKVLYDVIGKVGLRPLDATPTAARKYTVAKPATKTRPEEPSRLYAGQRDTAESLDEYRMRVREHIVENVNDYYVRADVVRTEEDELDSAADDWQTARNIAEAGRLGRYPRNPDSCLKYGTTCEYLDVCTRQVAIDDPVHFRKTAGKHDELAIDDKVRLPVISNSEMSTFRSCSRKHHYSYRLGFRPHGQKDALRFGTLIHAGLEAWWSYVKSAQAPKSTAGAMVRIESAISGDDAAKKTVDAHVEHVMNNEPVAAPAERFKAPF